MIPGYLLTLFRHVKKHWHIALTTILSYGLGIAACLVLVQYICYETSYDRFYKDHKSIYRVTLDNYYSNIYQNSTAHTFVPLGQALIEKYPEVQAATTINSRPGEVVTAGEKTFFEKGIMAADSNFFKVFSLDMIKGSTDVVMPNDVFISETIAAKYFSNADPIGNTMKIDSDLYTIQGVFKDLPANTHLKYKIFYILPAEVSTDWNVAYIYTYIRLNGNPELFDQKLKNFSEEFSRLSNQQSEADYTFQAKVQPLTNIHLKSGLLNEPELNGKIQDIYILIGIAIMILLVTCFNYINMTNAINADRSKEVFIRKIHGASHRSAILQHIVDSLTLNAVGFAVAVLFLIVFVYWVGPFFNFNIQLDWTNAVHYYTLLILFIIASVLSGILPAIVSSHTNLAQSLNRTSPTNKVHVGFSRNMAIVQFIISYILISGALVVVKQVSFLREGEIGFDYTGVIALDIKAVSYARNASNFLKLKNDLEKIASVQQVSFSRRVPGEKLYDSSIRLADKPLENTQNCNIEIATSDFFATYAIEIVAGRVFSENRAADANTVLVNESLARKLDNFNYQSIIGKEVTVDYMRRPVNFTVVGVVNDYYHDSKKQEVQPMLYIPLANSNGVFRVSVRLNSVDEGGRKSSADLIQQAVKNNLSEVYSSSGIEVAFDVIDVEANYNEHYKSDEQFSKFVNALAFLAILMAGIGFFSLASSIIRKRTKEIVIRKICGAQVLDVSLLLLTYFLKLVGIAFITALPISYFLVQDWLNDFPVRIGIGAWFILWPVILTIVVTLLSVSYHVMKVVMVNPIHHLRNE